jgi:DNA-directed RNA polymerase subunit H (RpoH/RPB5)
MTDKYQYRQYQNLRKAFLSTEYRGLESKDPELKYEEFAKQLLAQKFVTIKCRYPDSFRRPEYRGRPAIVVLTRYDSEFHNRSKELTTLLDKISSFPEVKSSSLTDLFLITSQDLKKKPMGVARSYTNFSFTHILSVRFTEELPKANLCSRHVVATEEEIKRLRQECYIKIDKLKYIAEDDAQNIWVGGFPGEVLRIEKASQMAGLSLDYRYITGQIPKVDNSTEEDDADEKEEDSEH